MNKQEELLEDFAGYLYNKYFAYDLEIKRWKELPEVHDLRDEFRKEAHAELAHLHSRSVVIQGAEFNAIDFAYPDVSSNTGYFKIEPLI